MSGTRRHDDDPLRPEPAVTADYQGHVTYRAGSRPALGLLAGLAAALVAAAAWGALAATTGYRLGFLAIGVGYLVGTAVRLAGNSTHEGFGVYAAVNAVAATAVGKAVTVVMIMSNQRGTPPSEILGQPLVIASLMFGTSGVFDLLYYGLAAYFGFRTAYHRFT